MSQLRVNDFIKNGRYQLTERLGGGVQGNVYRVTDYSVPHAQKVAKICEKRALGRHECEILRKLTRSPYSVSFHEVFDLDGGYCAVVTDYGGESLETLRDRKKERRFVDSNVCRLLWDMICGVERLHDAGYVHRDLHGNNICVRFVNSTAKVYLIDYGLSVRTTCFARTRSHSHSQRNFADGLQSSVAVMRGGKYEPIDDVYALAYLSLVLVGQQRLVHHVSPKTMMKRKLALDVDTKKVLRPTKFLTALFLELKDQRQAGVDYDELRRAVVNNKSCGNRKGTYRLERVNGKQNFK